MKIGLVGRVNVWKSTLFNRLLGNYRAIVTDIAWTTREIISEEMYIDDKKYAVLMDSPWLEDFSQEIKFIEKIIIDSDILVFVVDWKAWLTVLDQDIQKLILKHGKKDMTILAINKLDGKADERWSIQMADFYQLWFDHILPVSAKLWEWINEIQKKFENMSKKKKIPFEIKAKEEAWIKIAIVWRPNVGKSTLINKFFWDEISFVSDQAWTTLDYMTCEINYKNKKYKFYDTAWIRKKWKIHWLEKIALDKTLKMIDFVKPVVVLLIDVVEGVTHRDLSLLGDLIQLNVPIVVALNKIDEIWKDVYERVFKQCVVQFDFAKWIPIIPISAQKWTGLPKLLDFVTDIHSHLNKRIPTPQLNKAMSEAWIKNPPKFPKNKVCKFHYASQVEQLPPKFLFFINKEDNLNFAFKKWIENVIRNNFWFIWIPLVFEFREKKKNIDEFRNNDERHKFED